MEAGVGQPRAGGAMDLRRAAPLSQPPSSSLTGSALGAVSNIIPPITDKALRRTVPTPFKTSLTADGIMDRSPVTPAPSKPSLSARPVGEFVGRPPTTPALPVGELTARPPAITPAITPGVRAPITTPAIAPMPAPLPPVPAIPGGGVGFSGGVGRVPAESMLPPTPVLPSEIFKPTRQFDRIPMGQFDAMTRALQLKQGDPSRFIQTPATGVAPFGPAPAQERMIRRLRERELGRIL